MFAISAGCSERVRIGRFGSLCGALLLLLPPSTRQDPQTPQQSAPAAVANAIAQYDGPTDFDDVRDGSSGLRTRLDGLRESLSASPPNEWLGLAPALDSVRQRAEILRRDLNPAAEPSTDPVETALENIRRRLEGLQQHVGHRPE
jgi:hypothetical protein